MKKKVAILTATRAEYGLLRPLIFGLMKEESVAVSILVTGAHLSPEFGLTYQEIEKDGLHGFEKIPILLASDTPAAISKSMGLAMIGFADCFARNSIDMLIVLGDRYETLAVCCAAMNERIPIVHLYGGETTEGAVDEACRHAITKMSWLHFTSTEAYRRRVIQLGEDPSRVFHVGAMGVENALNMPLLDKEALEQSLHFSLDRPYACVTFHPVTLENHASADQTRELLAALDRFPDMKFIFTKANADADGRVINQLIDGYVSQRDNAIAFRSLGVTKYLSTVKYAEMVIGNSSSGLVEAPSFHVPTVNIGDRQKGRIEPASVIDCKPARDAIAHAIMKARSPAFQAAAKCAKNPYGDGATSEKIIRIVVNALKQDINLKKTFYDIAFTPERDGQ